MVIRWQTCCTLVLMQSNEVCVLLIWIQFLDLLYGRFAQTTSFDNVKKSQICRNILVNWISKSLKEPKTIYRYWMIWSKAMLTWQWVCITLSRLSITVSRVKKVLWPEIISIIKLLQLYWMTVANLAVFMGTLPICTKFYRLCA